MMKFMTTAIIALLALGPLALAGGVLELKSDATCEGEYVGLADVAKIQTVDSQLAEKLQKVFLGPAPQGKEVRILTRDYIKERLQNVGIEAEGINFEGAMLVEISATKIAANKPKTTATPIQSKDPAVKTALVEVSTKPVSSLMVAGFVKRFVSQSLNIPENKLQITLVGNTSVLQKIPAPDDNTEIVLQGKADLGNIMLNMSFNRDAVQILEPVQIQVQVKAFKQILVAQDSVRKGALLGSHNVAITSKEISSLRDWTSGDIENLEQLVNCRAHRAISKNAAITSDAVEEIPMVDVNDIITVECRVAGILLIKTCRALSSGNKDDVITVENHLEKPYKRFLVRVTEPRKALYLDPEEETKRAREILANKNDQGRN